MRIWWPFKGENEQVTVRMASALWRICLDASTRCLLAQPDADEHGGVE